jgi:hypothetical protein
MTGKLSDACVKEFIALYQSEWGRELEPKEAEELAVELLRLLALLGLH